LQQRFQKNCHFSFEFVLDEFETKLIYGCTMRLHHFNLFCDQNTHPEQVFMFASKDEFTLLISPIKYHSINNDPRIVIVPSILKK